MRVRFPLYGKILVWFFANLLVVAAVVGALFTAQFHFNLDWIFNAAGGRERLEAVRDLIIGELMVTLPDEWEQVMDRYSAAHHVRFALFDDEARPLVGGIAELPPEVRTRILERPSFPRRPPAPDGFTDRPPSATPAVAAATPEGQRRWPRPPLRALMRTDDPTSYWLLASGRLENQMLGDPMRIVLVARSSTISGGGFILNPRPWLALGFGVIIFSLIFWLPLVRGITRTIRRMMLATRSIADGRFDMRVNLHRRDELGALAESIDQMAVRLDGLMNGQKRFLGDIAHELCSPLARLQMSLGILEQHATGAQAEFVRSASEKAEQISALVGELLSFSKASFGAQVVRLQPVPLARVVEEATYRESVEGIEIETAVSEDLWVSADADLLLRAVANLLRNAVLHAGPAGPIAIRAEQHGKEVSLTIADHGSGVPEEELLKIFDAFYRLDSSRTRETGGTGLGLSIVRSCVESCAGTIIARNRSPHGLEMVITLAAAPAPAAAAAAITTSTTVEAGQ